MVDGAGSDHVNIEFIHLDVALLNNRVVISWEYIVLSL